MSTHANYNLRRKCGLNIMRAKLGIRSSWKLKDIHPSTINSKVRILFMKQLNSYGIISLITIELACNSLPTVKVFFLNFKTFCSKIKCINIFLFKYWILNTRGIITLNFDIHISTLHLSPKLRAHRIEYLSSPLLPLNAHTHVDSRFNCLDRKSVV